MIKVERSAGIPYDAPLHHDVYGVLKLTKEQTKTTILNYSYFLPSGGADMSSAPVDRIYIVMKGSITVRGKADDENHILNTGDILYIAAGEEREVSINNGETAEVLVVVVDAQV